MAKSKPIKWADVYQCEISAHAQLIACILNANGLLTNVQQKKAAKSNQSVPFVQVNKSQELHAKTLMSQYNLH